MKPINISLYPVVIFLCANYFSTASPSSGFFLPDSVSEMTISYSPVDNMIVLPVTINGSVTLNLILDTGCRNLVLFGKRFEKFFTFLPGTPVQFSGLGSGKPVKGKLSLYNKVSIHEVLGHRIPIVVVPNRNVLAQYNDVDGVIGYDIFQKFEVEVNPRKHTITFRPANKAVPRAGFASISLAILDSRPVLKSEIKLIDDADRIYELMIDTGSALGLLMKTTNVDTFVERGTSTLIGYGLNGPITGYNVHTKSVKIEDIEILTSNAAIIESPWHDYASIGMDVLKDYVFVINYCKAYACLKRIDT